MSGFASLAELPAAFFRESGGWTKRFARAENLLISIALAVMVLLPLAEAGLRRTFHVAIPASTSIVQHMVLVVGMLGGAIAAREGRLLSLSTLGETSLHGSFKSVSRFFTSSVSAAISGFLCVAAYQFVQTEQGAGKILAYGIPVWVVEWVLPLGFGAIAIRILLHASARSGTRAAATAFAILLAAVATHWPGGFHHLVPIALGTLFVISLL